MGKPQRKNGWLAAARRRGRPPGPMPYKRPEFELILEQNKIQAGQAATNQVARKWIKTHYKSCWVPENVLDAVGISPWMREL